MVVDLPEPEEPTSAVTVPGSATNGTSCQHDALAVVAEADVFKLHATNDVCEGHGALRILIFLPFAQNLLTCAQARRRLSVICVPMATI